MNLALVGYRGSGKSGVARRLALATARDWIDADVEAELRFGRSIAEIFATAGEPAFRRLESEILAELACRDGIILATGGGVILDPANRVLLRDRFFTVWLRAPAPVLLERIQADPETGTRRPALSTLPGLDEVRLLAAAREPLYREVARAAVDTETLPPDAVAAAVLELLPREFIHRGPA